MARTSTLANLKSDIAFLADVPAFSATTRPTETQITRWINRALYRFSHRHAMFGTRFKSDTISVSSGTTSYALPTDFAALRYFRFTVNGERQKIERGSVDEVDREDTDSLGWSTGRAYYWLAGRNVVFTDPKASYTVTVGYVPELEAFNIGGTAISDMSAATDYINSEGGVDDWVALDVAIAVLDFEDRDSTALRMQREEVEQRLIDTLTERDADESLRVRNTWDRNRWQ